MIKYTPEKIQQVKSLIQHILEHGYPRTDPVDPKESTEQSLRVTGADNRIAYFLIYFSQNLDQFKWLISDEDFDLFLSYYQSFK